MSRRGYTDPRDVAEVKRLKKAGYTVELWQDGVWLVEGWLFIYPKNQKWGERYRQIYGYYDSGKLEQFVEKACENKFDKDRVFYGEDKLAHE